MILFARVVRNSMSLGAFYILLFLLLLSHVYSVDLISCTYDSLNNKGVWKPLVINNLLCGFDP